MQLFANLDPNVHHPSHMILEVYAVSLPKYNQRSEGTNDGVQNKNSFPRATCFIEKYYK